MPSYPHIERYYEDLRKLIEFGGSTNEQSIRPAFAYCLDSYCREHRERMALVPELALASGVRPDGTVKDALRMARGYWEAKDSHDDLDTEIQKKFNRGYPRGNIVFEDSQTAVLFQNGDEAMRVDMRRSGELHRLIRAFLDYELPELEEFRGAWRQFKDDLPSVLANLRETVEEAEANNAAYRTAAAVFLDLCRKTIGPDVSEADVREMLLQHILTKDIFLRIFGTAQFHRDNNIAKQLDALEQTFFTGDVYLNAIDNLRKYYGVVGRAADEITDYAEKQQFLKAFYEDFYKVYNPAAADRLGVVYTPNEIVDFMIRGTDHLLHKHFGSGLADDKVQILDPATGTGTFITNLINYLPLDRLEHKYRNEMHANEVAILPYYIANLNIEYTFKERTGRYKEFPNLCFVDTLDNVDWEGATGGAVQRQGAFNLGALSEENWIRIQEQNEETISVIIGNPPYNDSATSWGDNTDNRAYSKIGKRIRETYVKDSTATKTHQHDTYKYFIRWASDRLANDGILCFITNRAYIDSLQDDGFRKTMADEFSDLYIVDLGGNYQKGHQPGNVFGIRIGVAVGFFVRKKKQQNVGRVHYYALDNETSRAGKLSALQVLNLDDITFTDVVPDEQGNWVTLSNAHFKTLPPLAVNRARFSNGLANKQTIFEMICPGVKTDRDEWVYGFDFDSLREKVAFFIDTYNACFNVEGSGYRLPLKWSDTLLARFNRGERMIYDNTKLIQSLYRPYTLKSHFADLALNDRLTNNHLIMFGGDLRQPNQVICFKGPAANFFSVLATNRLANEKFAGTNDGGTYCLPRYRYTEDGERVSNITQWGLRQVNEHYRKEWGKDFARIYPEGIGPDDLFAYTYAVLHDPVYRYDYEKDLLREFPRLPFYHDFDLWAQMGQKLLDLHIGFESVEPYPLEREESGNPPGKPKLRVDKEKGIIVLDGATRLTGVPEDAWRYVLGNRSALEWVLDQYEERKPKDPTVAERFDTYRFADHKEHVIDLLRRVCTVSVKTMEIVDRMAYWDGGRLIVFGDRDKHEWAMMGLAEGRRNHDS